MRGENTILLVEDEVIVSLAEAEIIKSFGYNVLLVNSGEKAIEMMNADPGIDLLLMDIDLGKGMDGTETAVEILKTHDIPIVFLSGHMEPWIVEKTEKITSYGYIAKGSTPTLLRSAIKMAFNLFEANQKYKLSHNKLKAIVGALPDLLLVVDREGYIGEYENSPQFTAFPTLGKTLPGSNLGDILPQQEVAFQLSLFRTCLATGEIQEHSFALLIGTEEKFFDLRVSRLDEDHVLAIIRDITTRKKTEAALIQTQSLLQEMGHIAKIGAWRTDVETNHIEWTQELYSIYQVDDTFIPTLKNIFDFELPDSRKLHEQVLKDTIEKGKPYDVEVEIITAKGVKKYLRITGRLNRIDGKISHRVGVTQDITERKHTESVLQESETRLKTIISEAPLGIAIGNTRTGKIQSANPMFAEIVARQQEEITDINWMSITHPDDIAEDREKMALLYENKIPGYQMEKRYLRPDGSFIWVNMTIASICLRGGDRSHYLCMVEDITKRKSADEKIKSLLLEKELLLKEVQHRIKNNMCTMMSILSLQASTLQDSHAVSALKTAQNRFQSMAVLYEKLYNSENIKEMSVLDYLPPLLREIISMFPNRENVTLETFIDNFILGVKEISSIGIIVNELITNAMKHAFNGNLQGTLKVFAQKSGNQVLLRVEDNGCGIPEPAEIENSSSFGLTLVETLVNQLKGTLRISRDNGTSFLIEFKI